MAVVLSVTDKHARIGVVDGREGLVPLTQLAWARPWREGQRVGAKVRRPGNVLQVGDVVLVEAISSEAKGYQSDSYHLRQIPDVGGAIVALDPHTGRVLAMVGGFSYAASEFNRATQALRQTGSAFKPIVYSAALDNGFSPSSLILDAPFVLDQGPPQGKWKPSNYTNRFYGPSTLRLGVEKSRNLMTVRLAQYVGMDIISQYAGRLGVIEKMEEYLPMALGAGETTLLKLTTAYAMFVNGGKRIQSTFIDRIQDRRGRTVFRHDQRPCPDCLVGHWLDQEEPNVPDARERVLDARTAYQIVSILEGVVQRGTGRRVRSIGKPLGGKTGTTNDLRDTWFVGFSPDLAVGVFAGFDQPKNMGPREQSASVAAPIFKMFFEEVLKDQAAIPFRVPPGINLVRVNSRTGRPARPGAKHVIWEAFKADDLKRLNASVLDGSELAADSSGRTPRRGSGGLY